MKPLFQQLSARDGVAEIRTPVSATARLAAVGDLAFHGPLLEKITGDTPGFIFAEIQAHLQAADVAVGNLESVLIRHPYSPVSGKAFLVSGLGALTELKAAGFDVLTFANNHILDAGPDGLAETLDGLAAAGLPTTGAGRTPDEARQPVRRSASGLDFAVYSYSYGCGQIVGPGKPGCNASDLKGILTDLKTYGRPGDLQVVCLHMDAEFQATPAPDRMAFCRRLADAGVQMVLCHHPHVPQGLEVHNGALIVYSLGNFVFPMMPYLMAASPDCDKSFLLEVEVDREGPVGVRVVPVVLDAAGRPVLPQGEARADLLTMIAERSALLADPDAIRGNYLAMTTRYTRDLLRNLYWAVGERDWAKAKLFLSSLRVSDTHRRWVRHYFRDKLLGR